MSESLALIIVESLVILVKKSVTVRIKEILKIDRFILLENFKICFPNPYARLDASVYSKFITGFDASGQSSAGMLKTALVTHLRQSVVLSCQLRKRMFAKR